MKRRYTIEYFDELVNRFREAIPKIAITTDIIVGFPGEEEPDFQNTYDYMEKTKFDIAFTFKYSPRAGAKAFGWGDTVEEVEKVRRLEAIVDLQEEITLALNHNELGAVTEVLVEGEARREEGCWFGKSPNFKTVVFPKNGSRPGEFAKVKIDRVTPHTLMGHLVH
jgi:tRNA-2-methylthio-N6-dimethylallyladenosine synthase